MSEFMRKYMLSVLSPEELAELMAAGEYAAKGVRDPEVMRKAREKMDEVREQIFRREGLLDIGVPAIRELRGGYGDDEFKSNDA